MACALHAPVPDMPFALHALVTCVLFCFTCILHHVPCTLHALMFQLPQLPCMVKWFICLALVPHVPYTIRAFVSHLPDTLVTLMSLMLHLFQVSHARHILIHHKSCSSHVLCPLCFWCFWYLSLFLLLLDYNSSIPFELLLKETYY